jgi:hypothetical protein
VASRGEKVERPSILNQHSTFSMSFVTCPKGEMMNFQGSKHNPAMQNRFGPAHNHFPINSDRLENIQAQRAASE